MKVCLNRRFEIELSQRLRKMREYKKLTQQNVADYLGISRPTYTYYETGKTEPNLQTVVKLAQLYGVSTDLIITGKKRKK
ncbi:MAG: helix-turn-helix transcriptional regulator [Clostridia bacterium]